MFGMLIFTLWASISVSSLEGGMNVQCDDLALNYDITVHATGIGRKPEFGSAAQRKLMAERAAEINALAEIVKVYGGGPTGRTPPFRRLFTRALQNGHVSVGVEARIPWNRRVGTEGANNQAPGIDHNIGNTMPQDKRIIRTESMRLIVTKRPGAGRTRRGSAHCTSPGKGIRQRP